MGTTTNYAFPYPAGTDPNDVPADLQALADAIDTAVKTLDDAVAAYHAAGAITNAMLETDAVTLAKMANNSVGTNELIDDAVTDGKIGAPSTGSLDGGNIRYARYGNLVVVWSTASTAGATLPAGFRPAATVRAPVYSVALSAAGDLTITTGGVITLLGGGAGTNGYFSVAFSTV